MVLLAFFPVAHAMETDNLTGRFKQIAALKDSTKVLDKFVNDRIAAAIQKTDGCDTEELIRHLRYELNRNPVGEVERFAELDESVDKYESPFDSSIYGKGVEKISDLTHTQKVFFWSKLKAATVHVNGDVIGTDKLGHFFAQGYEYFTQKDWRAAIDHGIKLENTIYGLTWSGVYSNGDLSANFYGYLFWLRVLGGNHPYVACGPRGFYQSGKFTWKDYVTPAWDEGINCSAFATKEYAQAVHEREVMAHAVCPVDTNACRRIVHHPCAAYFVSDECFKAAHISKVYNDAACGRFFRSQPAASCGGQEGRMDSIIDWLDETLGNMSFPLLKLEGMWKETK